VAEGKSVRCAAGNYADARNFQSSFRASFLDELAVSGRYRGIKIIPLNFNHLLDQPRTDHVLDAYEHHRKGNAPQSGIPT
jgi:hypothetical protein